MKYLNLGCGARFHPDWVNIDFVSSHPAVAEHDLRMGIPYPDSSFQMVYHSHVLEHFPKQKALDFMKECHRVLVRNGVIRVAVPDLEQIARLYLEALDRALAGEEEWKHHYEWMMLEMYDQVVRERSGGAMAEYLMKSPLPNEGFVRKRMGGEAVRILDGIRKQVSGNSEVPSRSRRILGRILKLPQRVRSALVRVLLGREAQAMLVASRFRASGEIHHWMYDRNSLKILMENAGFREARRVSPTECRIPGWASFNLDSEPDGTAYKPDSLYMEAVKD